MSRIFVTGWPMCGKSTFSESFDHDDVRHTDDFSDFEWHEQSDLVYQWIENREIRVIEGVVLPRAIRKWLDENSIGRPCDYLIWMCHPKRELSYGQKRMGLALDTVMNEIYIELLQRGVDVIGFGKDYNDEIHVF